MAILKKAGDHSDSEAGTQLPAAFFNPRLLEVAWTSVSTTLNFQNFFVLEVAFIYEEAFINAKTRKELGIHSTPESLVNHIFEICPGSKLTSNKGVFLNRFADTEFFWRAVWNA